MKYEGFTPNTFKHQWTPFAVSALSAFLLAGAVTTTANAQDNGNNVQTEQNNDVAWTINFTYNGQTVGTKTYTVPKNSEFDYGKDIPAGYTMNGASTAIKSGTENINLNVSVDKVTPVSNDVTWMINFTYNGQTIGTKTYTVPKNSEFDYGKDIPAGYTMNGASTTIKSGTENTNLNLDIAKNQVVSNDAKLTIHFTYGQQELSTVTRTVAKNSDYDFSKDIPSGYNMGTSSTIQHVGDGDFDLSIKVLKNEEQQPASGNVTMTANFKSNNQVVGTKTYTVAKNSEIDYSKDIPAGYHNADENSTYKAGDNNGDFDVNVIKDASQQPTDNDVTANFIFKYNGQTLSTKSYTAAKNSEIDYGSAVPSGYKLNAQSTKFNVGEADSTNTFELSKIDTGSGAINYTPYFNQNQTSAANNTSAGSDAPIIFYSAPSSTSSSATSTSVSAQSSSAESSTSSSVSSNAQSSASQSSASNSASNGEYDSTSNSNSASHVSASNNAYHKKHLGVSSKHNHKHADKKIESHNKTTNGPAAKDNHNVTSKHQSNSNQAKLPQTGESSFAKSISLIGLIMVAFAGVLVSLFKRSK